MITNILEILPHENFKRSLTSRLEDQVFSSAIDAMSF